MAAASTHLDRFSAFEELLYSRRYCGVSLVHPGLASGGLSALLAALGADGTVSLGSVSGFEAYRVALVIPRNYFGKIEDQSLAVGDDFVQELYVCLAGQTPDRPFPVVVLLAPYVRLLNRVLTRLGRALGRSGLEYVTPDMDKVFELFEKATVDNMDATRIAVRDSSEPTVELISLTGRNPLKSNLREELRKVGPAYSIRVEVARLGSSVRVHMDRFGNYWWYHRSEADIEGPLALLELLLNNLELVRLPFRPTSRVTPSTDAD